MFHATDQFHMHVQGMSSETLWRRQKEPLSTKQKTAFALGSRTVVYCL